MGPEATGGNKPEEPLGERLHRLRTERGLTQRQLQAPGCSYAYISRIERGQKTPSLGVVRLLARRLGVAPEYLETGRSVSETSSLQLRLHDAELELRLGDDVQAARLTLETLLEDARGAGDDDVATRVLALLGLGAFNCGNHSHAVTLLEEATSGEAVTPVLRPDAYVALARSYQALGRLDEAIRLMRRCLDLTRGPEQADVAVHTRYALWLGYALMDSGRLEEARQVVDAAIERGRNAPDQNRQAFLYWSLGRIAAMEGEVGAGCDYMAQAISLLKATENTQELARAHLAYGCMLNLADRYEDAAEPLAYAARLLEGGGRQDLGLVRTEQAKIAMHRRDRPLAKERASEALILLEEDVLMQGGALWVYAWAHAADSPAEGAMIYAEAVSALANAHELRDAARASREHAEALQRIGRSEEALLALERARELDHEGTAARS